MPHLIVLGANGEPVFGTDTLGHENIAEPDHPAGRYFIDLEAIRLGLGLDRIEHLLEKIAKEEKKK